MRMRYFRRLTNSRIASCVLSTTLIRSNIGTLRCGPRDGRTRRGGDMLAEYPWATVPSTAAGLAAPPPKNDLRYRLFAELASLPGISQGILHIG